MTVLLLLLLLYGDEANKDAKITTCSHNSCLMAEQRVHTHTHTHTIIW